MGALIGLFVNSKAAKLGTLIKLWIMTIKPQIVIKLSCLLIIRMLIIPSELLGIEKNVDSVPQLQHVSPIKPPLLQPKDTVAIVAPAWWDTNKDQIIQATYKILNSWGLKVVIGKSIGPQFGQFAGEDGLRLADLQSMLDNPTIKAIIAYRGGYGSARIIDSLNFDKFLQHPKWVVGFSDITTMHLKIHQLGVVSVHGEMPKHFPDSSYERSINSLRSVLFEGISQLSAKPSMYNRLGEVVAPVVGGNLVLICSNIGTDTELDTKGKILVVEEIGEQLYALDRMMNQLKRAGKLQDLAGLIIGDMVDMKDITNMPFGKTAQAIIQEHVAEYGYPVAFNFPIGHQAPNIAFLHGAVGKLLVTEQSVSLLF